MSTTVSEGGLAVAWRSSTTRRMFRTRAGIS
jgi:hypothetical protein